MESDGLTTATKDVGSVHSLNNLHDIPLPTTPDENYEITVKRFSYVFGFLYSVFLIILAVLICFFSATFNKGLWSILISLYIVISGSVILCVLIVDVKLFTRRIRNQVVKIWNKDDELPLNSDHLIQLNAMGNEDKVPNNDVALPNDAALTCDFHDEELETIHHHYCFSQGRHAGSNYLKFGAAAFALGHFVHTVLLVTLVKLSASVNHGDCLNVLQLTTDVAESIYCFLQLYFVFNYSNLIIIKHATLARVAFLHIMAGNLCLWVSAVTTETKLAYRAYERATQDQNGTTIDSDAYCSPTINVAKIFDDYSAYLYPFTVEFNILTVGIFFMIWRNIGKCRHSAEEAREFQNSLYAPTNISGEVNSPHAVDIHISCRNAMGGLFSSLFIVVALFVAIILGFVFGTMDDENLQHMGNVIGDSMNLLFHSTMLVATAVALSKTSRLDVNQHPVPWLDDVLLYVCVPAFFLETMLTVVAVVNILNVVKLLDTIIMSLQMVVQIAFVIDGLRRCSNSRRLRRTRPGRELVLLLLVCNVCMWLLYTFSYKSPESKDERYAFYGKQVWLAVGHLCAPLIMFFRFHSSVCIADIWSYAYIPGVEDH